MGSNTGLVDSQALLYISRRVEIERASEQMERTKIYGQEVTGLLASWPPKDEGRDHGLEDIRTTIISR